MSKKITSNKVLVRVIVVLRHTKIGGALADGLLGFGASKAIRRRSSSTGRANLWACDRSKELLRRFSSAYRIGIHSRSLFAKLLYDLDTASGSNFFLHSFVLVTGKPAL